jgi:hypothetical protein
VRALAVIITDDEVRWQPGPIDFDELVLVSTWRILFANWYYKATIRALEGDAKLKYFQHAGALLTADGSDDNLIKLEGTPPGYKLVF